jgi:hypothetical protein
MLPAAPGFTEAMTDQQLGLVAGLVVPVQELGDHYNQSLKGMPRPTLFETFDHYLTNPS